MKRAWVWFWLSCKRWVFKPSFLAVLLLLPIASYVSARAGESEASGIRIAVCAQDGAGELGSELANRLAGKDPKSESMTGQQMPDGQAGMFDFYLCQDEQEVKDEVASRRAECGYVIYEGFEQRLKSGQYKRIIGVYSAPSTVAAKLSTETVFAALASLYGQELLVDYVQQNELFDSIGAPESSARVALGTEAAGLYQKWMQSGRTFRLSYTMADANGSAQDDGAIGQTKSAPSVFPIRGLVAVYLFVAALYSAVSLGMDEERGLFLPLAYELRLPCRIAAMSAPVVLAGMSGLAALMAGGQSRSWMPELGAMVIYLAVLIAFCFLLKGICRRPQVLCCTIPFFIIGSLLFCPVFVDISQFIPGWGVVGRLFPPYYYLTGRFFW